MTQTYFYTHFLDNEDETELLVEYTISGGCAAQLYGPPEDCYPAEPPEVEIVKVVLVADITPDGKDILVELSDAEIEKVTNLIIETHEPDEGYDYDDEY